MYIKNGKLFIEDKSVFRHSPNFYNSVQQKFLVLHYTAGRGIDSTVNFMSNSSSMRSSHFVVGRDGKIAQLVHTSNGAWHAGKSTYTFNGETYISLNKYSIGIEIDNYGYLEKKEDEDGDTDRDFTVILPSPTETPKVEVEAMGAAEEVKVKKIAKLIWHWLKIIPGVNKFFLEKNPYFFY